jgi:type I restriction enzyme M protein
MTDDSPNAANTAAGTTTVGAQAPAGPSYEGLRFSEITSFVWSVADLLRGDYKQSEYGRVILPFVVLRRLDCVLDPTRKAVREKYLEFQQKGMSNLEPILNQAAGVPFHNTSKLAFAQLRDDPGHIADNLRSYVKGFSQDVRDIIERFGFDDQISRLDEADLLFLVVGKFAEIDLHPDRVSNHGMGLVFEELIRRFSEQSNETAGEHFTPRDVIRLMVNLLFMEDDAVLTKAGIVRSLFDPACGTGGMLSVAEEHLGQLNPGARLEVFGQELNDESYAICKADMLIKGQNAENIARGNSFSQDGHAGRHFDFMLSNPPFGVEWKKVAPAIRDEAEKLGHAGRFGAGLPRINDGSLLFLQHMLAKMKPEGSRIAIVFNGSPLFTGDAGSGESEIRRWIIENDWLEAIVAMPEQLFYNTGIATYVWIVTNHKSPRRRGKVQLIDGSGFAHKMRKSLGNKRNELGEDNVATITRLYGDFVGSGQGESGGGAAGAGEPGAASKHNKHSKVCDGTDFGFHKIVVERPLRLNFQASPERIARLAEERAFANLAKSKKKGEAGRQEAELGRAFQQQILDALATMDPETIYIGRPAFLKAQKAALREAGLKLPAPIQKAILSALSEHDEAAEICRDKQGHPEPDTDLRDTESVPLKEDIQAYFEREVLPHVPDAWIDHDKTRVGYEIPFTRHFYEYTPLRPLAEIEAEIRELEGRIQGMLGEVLG